MEHEKEYLKNSDLDRLAADIGDDVYAASSLLESLDSGNLPYCVGCGDAIRHDRPRTGTIEKPVCMRCEFLEIDVYKVELNGSNLVERDPQQIIPLLESMDVDDEPYSVSKERMFLQKYIKLPEFQGF